MSRLLTNGEYNNNSSNNNRQIVDENTKARATIGTLFVIYIKQLLARNIDRIMEGWTMFHVDDNQSPYESLYIIVKAIWCDPISIELHDGDIKLFKSNHKLKISKDVILSDKEILPMYNMIIKFKAFLFGQVIDNKATSTSRWINCMYNDKVEPEFNRRQWISIFINKLMYVGINFGDGMHYDIILIACTKALHILSLYISTQTAIKNTDSREPMISLTNDDNKYLIDVIGWIQTSQYFQYMNKIKPYQRMNTS